MFQLFRNRPSDRGRDPRGRGGEGALDTTLRDRAFRVGCGLWILLALAAWIWLARSADDLFQALTRPAVTGPSPGNLDLELAPDLVVTGALFGVIELDDDGAPRFAPAEAVPLEPGLEFGWVVWLETGRPSVRWREIFRSASPDNWQIEGDGDYRLSEDRTTLTLEREVAPDAGRIANFWQVAPGDLPGPHRIQVFVEDAPVADFAFEVR